MKKILLPTDFSENAFIALEYASQVFGTTPCEFIIVHSFERQVTNLTSRIDIGKTESIVENLYIDTEIKCEEVKEQIIAKQGNTNHTFKTIATSISLSRAVNKLIVKEEIDYVFMGSKGRTGAADILLGSNTLSMIRKIKNAPLFVVPKDIEYKPLRNIAFATGLKRSFTPPELEPLLFVAKISEASIKIIHVQKSERKTETQRENFDQLLNILKPANPEHTWLPQSSDIYQTITSYLSEQEVDMLAMMYYRHNVIVRLFREATIKDLAKYLRVPFLILPGQK